MLQGLIFLCLNAKITEEVDKKSRFLTEIGCKCFILAVNLFAPRELSNVTYKELVVALQLHFKPKLLEIMERFNFHQYKQDQNQTIADYVLKLRSLAKTCNFGAFLD